MKEKRTSFKQAKLLLLVLFAIAAPFLSSAEESAIDGLQRCGLIGDASARLACYDQLIGRESSAATKVIEPSTKVIEPSALPQNDLGSEPLTARKDQWAEPASVIVKVTKCNKRGANKKYIFYLESGEVWKQISDKRLYFKDCNFGASIHKDYFGYKMQLQDSNKKFRVSRIR